MKKVLVDTNVFIDSIRIKDKLLEKLFLKVRKGEIEIFTSSLVVFELYCGLRGNSNQKKLVEAVLEPFEIVNLNSDISKFAGQFLKNNPQLKNVPVVDLLIGCQALYIGAWVATKNVRHYVSMPGLKIFK